MLDLIHHLEDDSSVEVTEQCYTFLQLAAEEEENASAEDTMGSHVQIFNEIFTQVRTSGETEDSMIPRARVHQMIKSRIVSE